MNGICYIVSAGDAPKELSFEKREGDVVIACDAGYRVLKDAMIDPDVFIGDGDSLGSIPDMPEKVVLPCVKDDTDTLAAIKYGFDHGYREFRLYGALGGRRFSHTLSNVKCLSYIARRGGRGVIVGDDCKVYLVTPEAGTLVLPDDGGYFSVFASGGEAVVSITDARYELDRATLTHDSSLGVSNESKGNAEVTVFSGEALVVTDK